MATRGSWTIIVTTALVALLSIATARIATAASADVSTYSISNQPLASTATYWTPMRLASARPMPLPLGAVNLSADEPLLADPPISSIGSSGRPPTLVAVPDYSNVLFTPAARVLDPLGLMPQMSSSSGFRFTSARLNPDAVAQLGAEAKHPNALNGQLFFKVPAGTTVP